MSKIRWRTDTDEDGNVIWRGRPEYPPLWQRPDLIALYLTGALVAALLIGAWLWPSH